MNMKILLLAALALPLLAWSQQVPAPGTYVTEGGWGEMTISPDMKLHIDSIGAWLATIILTG